MRQAKLGISWGHHTEEAKAKIRLSSIERFRTKESRQLVGRLTKAKLASPEMRLLISERSKAAWTPELRAYCSELASQRVPIYGRPTSLETRAKISVSLSGANHYNWKGGISKEPYPMLDDKLRERIKARDNYKCQICGVPEEECIRQLSIHHIDYDRENEDEHNLISLCVGCHIRTNYNRGYWQEYLTGLIAEIYVLERR